MIPFQFSFFKLLSQIDYLFNITTPDRAYSLRKLNPSATYAIRVKRSSDGTEQDFGWIGEDLNIAGILSFVGASDGLITIWYEQNGSGDDLVNSLADSTKPFIVTSGTLETVNGKPAVRFFAPDDTRLLGTITGNEVLDMSFIVDVDSTNARLINFNSPDAGVRNTLSNQLRIRGNSDVTIVTNTSTRGQLICGAYGESPVRTYWNGNVGGSGNRGAYGGGYFQLGVNSALNLTYTGYIQEVLLFKTDNSAFQSQIETNQNNYYGTF